MVFFSDRLIAFHCFQQVFFLSVKVIAYSYLTSSVKCVDVHHYACVKAVIIYLCNDPDNVFVQIFQNMKSN